MHRCSLAPSAGGDLVEQSGIDGGLRVLLVERGMGKEAQRTEAAVDRHDHHPAPRQRAAVLDREPAAAEDDGAVVDPDHHRQPGIRIGSRRKDIQTGNRANAGNSQCLAGILGK